MLYQTEAAHKHEYLVAKKAEDLGLEVSHLNKKELQELEPNTEILANGAIHYECDAHTTPTQVMPKLLAYLKNAGVEVKTGEEVVRVVSSGGKIKEIVSTSGAFKADEFVLAAGAWSGELAKLLSIQLPLQGGKGYRINLKKPTGITIPSILMEAKMAVTPMEGFTRFAGTMEFSGNNDKVRKERVIALAEGAKRYYPNIEIGEEEISKAQTGLRPVSPDGLPYIGKGSSISNLTFATGHAMMGWSLGPATGKLVSEVITGRPTSMNISPFHPDRKFK